MKIKGNYIFMFIMQFIAGIVTYFACLKFDLIGIGIGFSIFLTAMILVQTNYEPDEREFMLLHKANSYEGIFVAAIMAVVYLFFPGLNWFYVFAASISIVRGVIGTILFLTS